MSATKLWVIDGPHGVVGLANTIGSAVRLTKKAYPKAEWGDFSHDCLSGGYGISARVNRAWHIGGFDYYVFRFRRFSVPAAKQDVPTERE